MHYFLLIYFNSKPLHVSSILAAHHQEDQLCMDSNWCSRATIPIAVYKELILQMMSSKSARNM